MRKSKVFLATILGTTLALASAVASAAPASGPLSALNALSSSSTDTATTSDHPLIAGLRQLKLSDDQISSIRKIFSAHRDEIRAARTNAHEKLENFVALDPQAADYAATITQLASVAQNKVVERMQHAADIQTQIYSILTAEQKAQLPTIAESVMQKHFAKKQDGSKMNKLGDVLSLSDTQRTQVKDILDRYAGQTHAMRDEMHSRVQRFIGLDPTSASYKSDIAGLTTEFSQSAHDRVQTMANLQTDLYAVLTPEQRTKLIELSKKDPRELMQQMRTDSSSATGLL
jgi:Spy/CpxP family protein refolding chaperone